MSSVFADRPRDAASLRPVESSPKRLSLVGETQSPEPSGKANWRAVIGGGFFSDGIGGAASNFNLYLATVVVIAVTGIWVVVNIVSKLGPVLEPVAISLPPKAPTLAPRLEIAKAEGPALVPPARLGDGVVVTEPAPRSLNPVASFEAAATSVAPAIPPSTFLRSDASRLDTARQAEPSMAQESVSQAGAAQGGAAQLKCLVKVAGHVLFEQNCAVDRSPASGVTLNLGDKSLVVSPVRGQTWTATMGGKSLGKVYPSGECWGRRKEVYVCAYGAKSG